jgi:hypothetical protein
MNTLISNLTRPKGDPKVLSTGPSSLTWADRLARNLGWFSIGLGVAELFGARSLNRKLGLYGMDGVTRAFGAREIASGIVTLSTERHIGLWMRVGGDILDIAMLSRGLHPWNPRRDNAKAALMSVIGITALDVIAAAAVTTQMQRPMSGQRTYTDRSGFPKGTQSARGAAVHRSPQVNGKADVHVGSIAPV